MKRKMYWGIALLAFMAVTVSCGNDDGEMDPRVANFVESTSYTEEMLTGFEPLGIQGEWEMLPWHGSWQPDFGEAASLFFNKEGKVRVLASDDDKFILPSGVYQYSFDLSDNALMIGDKRFKCELYRENLSIKIYMDSQVYSLSFKRERSAENAVPAFFEEMLDERFFPRPENPDALVFPKLYVLNSSEELAAIYKRDAEELPPIDFDRYTLLLGYVYLASRSTYPTEMDLREEDGKYYYTIHLTKDLKAAVTCDTWTYYFWRLYPKLHSNDVEVEITENIIND